MSQKALLMILDGWGIAPNHNVSAIDNAKTPFVDGLYEQYPHATLRTDGSHVGLPDGQMGNSEVGHMNLGAGRIVYQDLARISLAIKNDSLKDEPILQEGFHYAKTHNKAVHFLGLLSDGGVHSHVEHLEGLLAMTAAYNLPRVFVHAFTDGRDVVPQSGQGFISRIIDTLNRTGGTLASVIGRYYAMDRDQRWERVKEAYDLLVHGKGTATKDMIAEVQRSYDEGITDEFVKPLVAIDDTGKPVGIIQEGDVVVFFNFRTDRGRELTQALSQKVFPEYDMKPLSLQYITLTNYDDSFEGVHVVFDKENLQDTLGEVLEKEGKTQVRIAETEKYPHVTFFFNGGRETPFKGEDRILCPSPKVATYDLQPEMSAFEVRDAIVNKMNDDAPDFICLNFANPDMVGHTGNMEAAIKACETVDECAKGVINTALKHQYAIVVIADHGNCETMQNPDGSIHTAHTTNPVPIILVDSQNRNIRSGILGDVAPTILDIMGIEKPLKMTQTSLLC